MEGTLRQQRPREYRIWRAMKKRCRNKTELPYRDYGGRGIQVCPEWENSFEQFCRDMGKCPSDQHSIDRIDNDGNYAPCNCVWATPKQQANNRRNNRLITMRGKTQTLMQWCEELNLPYERYSNRIYVKGIDPETAFNTPRLRDFRSIEYDGKTQSLKAWAKELGIKYCTLHDRITRQGMTPSEALSK